MALTPKICTECGGAAGMPYMKGVVTQKFVAPVVENGQETTPEQPEITQWTCPYCGHSYPETIYFSQSGGNYNSGIGYKMSPVPQAPAQ